MAPRVAMSLGGTHVSVIKSRSKLFDMIKSLQIKDFKINDLIFRRPIEAGVIMSGGIVVGLAKLLCMEGWIRLLMLTSGACL